MRTMNMIVFLMLAAMLTSAPQQGAYAQVGIEQLLDQNCRRIGIDQCYRDGGNRFIRQFIDEIRTVASATDRRPIEALNIQAVADRNVLLAHAFMANGNGQIEISSGFLFYLHSISFSAVFATLHGTPEEEFNEYLMETISTLITNTRRAKLGQPLRSAKALSEVLGISADEEKRIMSTEKARALTALFFRTQFLWVLSHEIGHHILGHVPPSKNESAKESRQKERDADRYATGLVLKLGYSLAPMISGLTYFSAIETAAEGAEEGRTHPRSPCRLSDVLESGIREYSRRKAARDELNRQLNEIVLMNPHTPGVIRNMRALSNDCPA